MDTQEGPAAIDNELFKESFVAEWATEQTHILTSSTEVVNNHLP